MQEYRWGFADGIIFSLVLIGTAIALMVLFVTPTKIVTVSPEKLNEETKDD